MMNIARLRTLPLLGACLFQIGCSPFIVRRPDPVPVKVAKVMVRTIAGIGTLGVTEWAMSEAKYNDAHKQTDRFVRSQIGTWTIEDAVRYFGVPSGRFDGRTETVLKWGSNSTSTGYMMIGSIASPMTSKVGWNAELSFNAGTTTLTAVNYKWWQ